MDARRSLKILALITAALHLFVIVAGLLMGFPWLSIAATAAAICWVLWVRAVLKRIPGSSQDRDDGVDQR